MDAVTMIKERRSVRRFKDIPVDKNTIVDIISTAQYAPSWANSQIARYTIVDDKNTLNKICKEGFNKFQSNANILGNAAGAVVVSYIKGKSGYTPDGKIETSKKDGWKMFDAGIASQTFCLAAYEKGIGTVILGIYDEEKISEIINLPKNEEIATIIPYGYEETHPKMPPRNKIDDIVRCISE